MSKLSMTRIFALLAVWAIPGHLIAVELSEIRIYQSPGWGSDRYFELSGGIGEDISGCQYVVLTGTGFVIAEFRLSGVLEDGYFAATVWDVNEDGPTQQCTGYDFFVPAPLSQPGGLSFPVTGNTTYMIVSQSVEHGWGDVEWGMDLDSDDDGVLDTTPWDGIIDSVTVLHSTTTGGNAYSASTVGPEDGEIVPHHVIKCNGEWVIGQAEVCSDDTIGAFNCYTGPSGVPGVSTLPFVLQRIQPNPFNPQATIVLEMQRRTDVSIRIFDLAGRAVRTLLAGQSTEAGPLRVTWNGRDDSGRTVPSGAYFCRIDAGGTSQVSRMMLAK